MGTKLIKPRRNGINLQRLSDQQLIFVKELIADRNFSGTAAARKAGYKNPGPHAGQLLKQPKIQAALGKALRERIERCELKADLILQEVAYCALRDPIDLCDKNGSIKTNLHDIPEKIRRCIDSFKVKRTTNPETGEVTETIELKLAGKIASLELAMRHMGLLTDKKEVTIQNIDWTPLFKPSSNGHDPIEEKIINVGSE